VSNDRRVYHRTSADVDGRSFPGQADRGPGSPHCDLASGRRGHLEEASTAESGCSCIKGRRCAVPGPVSAPPLSLRPARRTPGPATAKPLIGPSAVVRQSLPARAVFLALTWSSAAMTTGRQRKAAASVSVRPFTFHGGDEAVGVDEADGERTDLTPEE
jgi:hypothetical protein